MEREGEGGAQTRYIDDATSHVLAETQTLRSTPRDGQQRGREEEGRGKGEGKTPTLPKSSVHTHGSARKQEDRGVETSMTEPQGG